MDLFFKFPQATLWLDTTFNAVALTIVRQESAADGGEQVAASFSRKEEADLAARLGMAGAGSGKLVGLKKLCLKDVNEHFQYVDAATHKRVYDIIGEKEMVQCLKEICLGWELIQ